MSGVGSTSSLQQVMALRSEVLSRNRALQDVHAATGNSPTQIDNQNPPQAGGFGDLLTDALQNVSAVQQRSGDMQAAYERGEVTDIAKVMLARQEAGVAFEATLQVRNKLLSAYQDIMRMGS